MADISIINKDNTNYNVKDAVGREALAVVENKGAKNLLKITSISEVKQGVRFTINEDGTITATRESAGTAGAFFTVGTFTGNSGVRYILSGCPATGSDSTYYMYLGSTYRDYGSGVEREGGTERNAVIYIDQNYSPDNLVFRPMICTKAEWDISHQYEPYAKTNAELTVENASQQSEINYSVNTGAKNILKVTAKSGSSYGITREVSDDGTITLTTGQAQNNPTLVGVSSEILVPKGNWILSGCPSGGGDSTYRLDIRISGTATVKAVDTGSGGNLTLSDDTTCSVFIRLAYNYSVSNLVFKPMLRPAAITDPTFQPYARTNPVLTAEMDYIVNAGAKNLIPINNLTTSEDSYCSWTVNTDNSITVTPKSAPLSSDWIRFVVTNFVLPAGTYIMSGGIAETSTSNKCDTYIADTDASPVVTIARGWTDGYQKFTLTQPTHIRFAIRIKTSYNSTTPVTFKPMVRSVEITDPTFQPYAKTNRDLTVITDEDRASLVELVDGGAKNVADMTKSTFTSNQKDGVTVTLSGDMITSTGTSGSATNQFHRIYYDAGKFLIPAGTWIAALIGTGTDAFRIEVNSSSYSDLVKGTYGNPVQFTIPEADTESYARITQKPNTNCAGTFKLMICTPTAWKISQTYQPYRPSWQEMYDRIVALENQNT